MLKNEDDELKSAKVLGGIDTLFFYADTYKCLELYQNHWEKVKIPDFDLSEYNLKYTGHTGQKTGFIGARYLRYYDDIPIYRIGFKDPNKQQLIPNILIQLNGAGIYSFGLVNLLDIVKIDLFNLFGVKYNFDNFMISRVDLNCFVSGFDFGSLTQDCFKTRCRKTRNIKSDLQDHYVNNGKTATLYIGNRPSPLYLRIYDKNLELLQSKKIDWDTKQIKKAFFSALGLTNKQLWNIEYQIKREVLKQYQIFSIGDLFKFGLSMFKDLQKRFVFLGFDVDKYKKYKENNHINRLKPHPIWKRITDEFYIDCFVDMPTERIFNSSKGLTKEYAIQNIKRMIDLTERKGVPLTNREKYDLLKIS